MSLIVQKYGGTSMGSIERIGHVADLVLARQREGHEMVVVVSAMSGETDRLLGLAGQIAEVPGLDEVDVLVSTGEQVSIALLALAIRERGGRARSFTGSQLPLRTVGDFGRARIDAIGGDGVRDALAAGEVAVVAGFQGVDPGGRITTLGRGGSDTTAVAVAAALGAEVCEIYTDVDGVYTADPNICPDARRIPRLSFEEMLEMASLGAKVLASRSVECGMRHEVPIRVLSTFQKGPGSWVGPEDESMEERLVTAVTHRKDEAKISLRGVPDHPGVAAKIFEPLAKAGAVIDVIVQNVSEAGHTDVTFTVPRVDLKRLAAVIEQVAEDVGAREVLRDPSIAKISVIGVGMRTHAGVAAEMFSVLSRVGVNIQMISTSEIKISCVIDEKYTELAVRELHDAFGLGTAPRRSGPSRRKKPAAPSRAPRKGAGRTAPRKR